MVWSPTWLKSIQRDGSLQNWESQEIYICYQIWISLDELLWDIQVKPRGFYGRCPWLFTNWCHIFKKNQFLLGHICIHVLHNVTRVCFSVKDFLLGNSYWDFQGFPSFYCIILHLGICPCVPLAGWSSPKQRRPILARSPGVIIINRSQTNLDENECCMCNRSYKIRTQDSHL